MIREGRGLDTTICFLAANKCDSEAREVDEVEARLWAELHGFIYCETSANTGLGITDMFQVSISFELYHQSSFVQGFFSQIVRLAELGMGSVRRGAQGSEARPRRRSGEWGCSRPTS